MGAIVGKQGKKNSYQEVPTFKIVLVGEPEAGKSSVFLRYTKNQFDYSYQPSVSVAIDNVVKKVNIPYQGIVSVIIWDVPGREEMDLRKSYYKDVDAAIVVVDVSDTETIGLAPTWKQDVLNHAQFSVEKKTDKDNFVTPAIPVLLLGNKVDKLKKNDEDTDKLDGDDDTQCESSSPIRELEDTAKKHGFIGSVAVSAKEGDGSVHEAIQTLIRHLLQKKMSKRQSTLRNLFNSSGAKQGGLCHNDADSEKAFLPFLKTGINEMDDLLKKCEQPIQIVEECAREYPKALQTFKRSCCVVDLVPSTKSSLEECIAGLKEVVVDDNGECALKFVDDGGFVKFVIVDDVLEDIPGPINKIIRLFHTRLAVVAKDTVIKSATAYGPLSSSQKQLDELLKSFEELANNSGLSRNAQTKAWTDVQANKARLADAVLLAIEQIHTVNNDCKRIKAAFLW